LAENVEHHRGVGHRWKNRAEAVHAVEPLSNEIDGSIDRPLPEALRKHSDGRPQHDVNGAKKHKPDPTLMRSLGRGADRLWRFNKQFVDLDSERVFGTRAQCLQNKKRHQHCTRPVRNF